MGDIQTHEELSRVIIGTFQQHWPYEVNYGFFELGNWLTDVSQFNDPYAFLCAKLTAWSQARPEVVRAIDDATFGFLTSPRAQMDDDDVLDMDRWADAMLGRPGRSGSLGGFLRNLVFFIGCEWFRRPQYGIPPDQFEEAFGDAFTQYFPHEHLDCPPWPHGEPWGSRGASPRAVHRCSESPTWRGALTPTSPGGGSGGGSARRLLAYLDDEIEYVAELLTWIEHEWTRINALPTPLSPDDERIKRLILIRWGHASHAIEDFFFHSNFVEFAWASNHRDGSVPTLPGADHHRQRRVFHRRRRSPAWDGRELSRSTSHAASRVYTGSFGGEDVYHTFADAMEGIPAEYFGLVPGRGGELLRQLGTEQGRRDMADPEGPERRAFLESWRQWSDHDAAANIRTAIAAGTIHRRSGAKLSRALDLDRTSFNSRHGPRFPWTLRGPFAFFTHLLCAAQVEHDDSERQSAALDAARREVENASQLGPSAENIGCHSLMSKDSPRKPPLRAQAMTQAAWVACYVARILARRLSGAAVCVPRLSSGAGSEEGCTINQQGSVDWLHLLQHFLCHPDECEQDWHLLPLGLDDPNEARRDDLPELTAHTLRLLTPSEVGPRLRLPMRDAMERRYRDLERDAEREWSRRT